MPWRLTKLQSEYRDVGPILQWLRDLFLGRKHELHCRFPKYMSPRSIPKPDVPRTLDYKYSNQYYYNRHYMDSAYPPVVAPIAEGTPGKSGHPAIPFYIRPTTKINFKSLPTPGTPWWWDGHQFYECVDDVPRTPKCPESFTACPPPPQEPYPPCPPCPKS